MHPKKILNTKSFIKIALGILLILPISYMFHRSNSPHYGLSPFEKTFLYCIPVLIVLVYILDTWNKSKKTFSLKIIRSIIILVPALILGVALGEVKRLSEDQTLGVIVIGLFLFSFSFAIFYFGAFQYKQLIVKDKSLKKFYYFSMGCFILSCFHVPFWVVFSGGFPLRNFSKLESAVIVFGILLGILGSGSPWIVLLRRLLSGGSYGGKK